MKKATPRPKTKLTRARKSGPVRNARKKGISSRAVKSELSKHVEERTRELTEEMKIINRNIQFREKMRTKNPTSPYAHKIKISSDEQTKINREHKKNIKLLETEMQKSHRAAVKLAKRSIQNQSKTIKSIRKFAAHYGAEKNRKQSTLLYSRISPEIEQNATYSNMACLWVATPQSERTATEIGPIGPVVQHDLVSTAPAVGNNSYGHLVDVQDATTMGEVLVRFDFMPDATRLANLVAYFDFHGVISFLTWDIWNAGFHFPGFSGITIEGFARVWNGDTWIEKKSTFWDWYETSYEFSVRSHPINDSREVKIEALPVFKDHNVCIYVGYRYILNGRCGRVIADFISAGNGWNIPLVFIPFYD